MHMWRLRPDQLPAYHAIFGKSRSIANMPTGWGKSFLLCCLGATDLLQAHRKIIICVPQRVIAKGFGRQMRIDLPNGKTVDWQVPKNLCDPTAAKVTQLVDFLRNPAHGPAKDRVVLVTHMSLSYAFQQLSEDEIVECFRFTTLFIDESHHVRASEFGQNQLGQVIATLLDANDPTIKIVLATAYFFRGDHSPIISESHLARFSRFHIPFDEYWNALKYVKTFSYDFVMYKAAVFRELETVLRQRQEPTIVYCPPEGHRMLLGKSKQSFMRRVRLLCEKHFGCQLWRPDTKASAKAKVIIDLVDTADRTEKIRFVANHGSHVAAVLTVGMFREGADWIEASRIIDLVPSGSDQDRLQRFGRLVRDCRGKRHVSYVNFFPYVLDQDEDDRRRELSKLYAHFHASLVLENAIRPIKVRIGIPGKNGDEKDGENVNRLDLLGNLDEKTQETIIRRCYEELIRLQDQKATLGLSLSADEARQAIVGVLKENGVSQHLDAMARQVILVMRRGANVQLNTDDLVNQGFDKVWAVDIFDGLLAYSAGAGGPESLSEIRKVIESVFESQWLDHFEEVKVLPRSPGSQDKAYWWCTHNKVLHSQGNLSEKRIELLQSIPWWSWQQSFEDRWQANYDEIAQLPACPKAGTTEYTWVRQQRRLREKGSLETYRIKALQAISWWTWATNSSNWDDKYQVLASLDEPPQRGTNEYEWMRTQRKSHKKGSLTPDRAKQLEAIPWWSWSERRSGRAEGLAELQTLIERGIAQGHSKADVRRQWAESLGIGDGQVHKYLRKLGPQHRSMWEQLIDHRGRKSG